MTKSRQAIAPVFLFLCIVMGGSAQGILSNLILQLTSIAIIAWAFLARVSVKSSSQGRLLEWLAASMVALILLQLVPLPPDIWSHLPGRHLVDDGYRMLGQPLSWMPLSLAPATTIANAMWLLPPLAMAALILRLGAYRDDWLVVALLLATFISVALGVMQVRGDGMSHYLYAYNAWGTAAGTFANANHMATLLLVGIPFLVAGGTARWRKLPTSKDRQLTMVLAAAAAIVLLLGVVMNHSLAMLVLVTPVTAIAVLWIIPAGGVRFARVGGAVAILMIAGMAVVGASGSAQLSTLKRTSIMIRSDIWSHTEHAIRDFGLVGSGIGTFPSVYSLYEDPATVDRTYINHAHNDYLEYALETGLPGIALMLLFLSWWMARSIAIWRSVNAPEMARAASIASAAVLLHTLVDYPLRTAAIATVMAMALGLMANFDRRRDPRGPADFRPARHLTL